MKMSQKMIMKKSKVFSINRKNFTFDIHNVKIWIGDEYDKKKFIFRKN